MIFDNNNEITIRTRSKKDNIYTPIIPLASEERLKSVIGDNLIFVHKNRFIAKTKTLDSAAMVVGESLKKKKNSSYIKPILVGGLGLGAVISSYFIYNTFRDDTL